MISTIHHLYFPNVLNVQVHYITFAIIVNPPNKNNNNLIWLLCIKNIVLFVKLDDAFIVTLNAAFGAETTQMQQII